jgi:hypothetical protein
MLHVAGLGRILWIGFLAAAARPGAVSLSARSRHSSRAQPGDPHQDGFLAQEPGHIFLARRVTTARCRPQIHRSLPIPDYRATVVRRFLVVFEGPASSSSRIEARQADRNPLRSVPAPENEKFFIPTGL